MRISYLILLVLGMNLFFTGNYAFADVTIVPAPGSGAPGCETTSSGCYYPKNAGVEIGETVIFSNTDTAAHTWTSGTPSDGPDGVFDTSLLMSGSSFEWTPYSAGEYPYHCMVHPWMVGSISVIEAAETLPPSISVWTDKSSYKEGDTIKISGKVTNPKSGSAVALIIKSPDNNLVSIASISLNYDDTFSSTVTAGGSLMDESGTYVIEVSHGSASDSVSFNYSVSTPTYPSPAPYGTDVTIPRDTATPGCEERNACYSPYRISTDEGETITWYNADSAAHTVTSGNPSDGPDGVFDSSMLMAGSSFSWTPYSAGEYPYFCMVHPWKIGIVSVNQVYTPPTYTPPTSDSGKISVSGISVTYSITGGKLHAITPDFDARSLIISIDATNDGSLTLTIPRNLLDATINNRDDNFFVLVTGEEVNFDEKTTSSTRVLTIAFPRGVEEIEIIGTYVNTGSNNFPTPTPTPTPYVPPPAVPSGMSIVIPSGTGAPGCEESRSCYDPYKFTVGKGSTVTWFNADTAAHTVTSGNPDSGPDGNFDSSLFMSGGSFSHKFNNDGTYPYFCMVHPWMTGYVIVQRGGPVISPPMTVPSPTPAPTIGSISVSTDDFQYSPSDLVTVKVSTSKSANVAVSVIGPSGDSIVSRSVTTDSRGNGSLQFKLPDSSQNGSYRVDSTATISGSKVSDSTSFTVKSTSSRVDILSLQPTDQQGNAVSTFTKGKLGFVKVILSSDSNVNSLVTINLFDRELTSLGIGSFKTTLSSGQSEMTLSFFIPNDSSSGSGDIYANVFSDWPSQGGVPLTGESSTQVRIQ